jgi:hypothetical protein
MFIQNLLFVPAALLPTVRGPGPAMLSRRPDDFCLVTQSFRSRYKRIKSLI